MPVLLYYSQKEAPSEAVIWRFLDLRKFRDLMANQELYFRRADLFDDQSEGLPPDQYVRRVLGLDLNDVKDQVALNNHLGSLAQSREMRRSGLGNQKVAYGEAENNAILNDVKN